MDQHEDQIHECCGVTVVLRTQIMNQGSNSVAYDKVLNEHMKFLMRVSPSKEDGDCINIQKLIKNS